jgi:DNA-binding NarL/FixJ family response regulator/Tfp pilus assembly protein PilF
MDEPQQNLSYLIIDDFEQMRVSFKGMLKDYGATDITTCPSGEKALKLLATSSFDVVLCDYNLGDGKDGQQVLEESRYLGYLGHAATFFMITAESNLPMVMSALEHQPDEYMVKPINRDVLHHRLAVILNRKRELKEIDEALIRDDKLRAIELCRSICGKDLKQRLYLAKLQAELCLDARRLDEAEVIYQEILAIRGFPWAQFGLSKILFLKDKHDQAERGFRELIEQNNLYLEVYDWLVGLLQKRAANEEAQKLLQKAVDLSPKAVIRQRKLGMLAEQNGDTERAERAFRAAIRWGKNSCFASAQEYRCLANIYQKSSRSAKVSRLFIEGRKRFSHQPSDCIQLLCGQASVQQHQGESVGVDACLDEIMRLVVENKRDITAYELLETADNLFQLPRLDEAQVLLKLVLSNHHDDEYWVERVRDLMLRYGLDHAVNELVSVAKSELQQIHDKCKALLRSDKLKQAITLLNDATDSYPRNRTLMLMAVGTMINYMRADGLEPAYHFRCRFALNHLLERDHEDPDADRFLNMLNEIAPSQAEESMSG